MNEEVVAETTDVDQADTTQAEGAQTDEKTLDDYLAEFDQERDAESDTPESSDTQDNDDDKQWLKDFRREREAEQTEQAVSSAAKQIIDGLGDDLPVTVSEDMVTDLLYGRASRDQKFLNAFLQRNQKPEAWGNVLKGVARKLINDFGKPIDTQVTNDREAVAASIRGNSTATEETPNFQNMSDAEFQAWKRKAR